MYSKEELSDLSRKELQKLCKKFNLKGNGKNIELALRIWSYFEDLQQEEKKLEKELEENVCPWMSEDEVEENNDDPLNSTFTFDKENENPKLTVTKEIEKNILEKKDILKKGIVERAEEENVTKYFKRQHTKNNKHMTSVDDYLAKRRERAEKMFSYQKKLKLDSERVFSRPQTPNNKDKKMRESKIIKVKDASSKVPVFKYTVPPAFTKANLKVDKEVSFNFKNSRPSFVTTKVSPRLVALKEKNVSNTNLSKKTPNRKSIHVSSQSKSRPSNGVSSLRTSIGVGNGVGTPNVKTPIKFDLEASLKKPLKYKPHTGKIKNVYFTADLKNAGKAQCQGADPLKKNLLGKKDKRKSLKDLTLNITTRESRRATAMAEKKVRRTEIYSKHRGILY